MIGFQNDWIPKWSMQKRPLVFLRPCLIPYQLHQIVQNNLEPSFWENAKTAGLLRRTVARDRPSTRSQDEKFYAVASGEGPARLRGRSRNGTMSSTRSSVARGRSFYAVASYAARRGVAFYAAGDYLQRQFLVSFGSKPTNNLAQLIRYQTWPQNP